MDDPGRSLGRALHTKGDYERAALDHPAVRHVKVKGPRDSKRIPAGSVEVRVSGRLRLPVPARALDELHADLAARHPIGIALRTCSGTRSKGRLR